MFGHDDNDDNQAPVNDDQALDTSQANPVQAEPSVATDNDPVNAEPVVVAEPAHDGPDDANQPKLENLEVISPAGGYPKIPTLNVKPGGEHGNKHKHKDEPKESSGQTSDQTDDLVGIRQHALNELTPLVDKLDLGPEDRFRALMMMIQANDNKDLLEAAYQAAHGIEDEKVKAQALLDVVNEINYFTQASQED